MSMVIYMMENGIMIWLMVMGSINIQEEQNMMVNGKMIYKMVKVKKVGQVIYINLHLISFLNINFK